MLFYSPWRRFLFIHVMKTAGTSVREALAPYARRPKGSPWRRLRERLGLAGPEPLAALPPHATAVEVRAALPEKTFKRYFKFAFVRNPWDWHVSWYHWLLQVPSHPHHAVVSRMKGFEEYLHWRVESYRLLQKDFVADARGRLLVDFLGRFERLEEDFATVCAAVGVRAGLIHLNRSVHRDYRCYYTDRTRELVETFWADDVESFGYRFDPPAGAAAPAVAGAPPHAPRPARGLVSFGAAEIRSGGGMEA